MKDQTSTTVSGLVALGSSVQQNLQRWGVCSGKEDGLP